jgi:hypothetical protein
MSLSEVHGRLAWAALLYFVAISIWGFIRFFRKQGIDSSFWGALAIGEVLLLVQSGLGLYLWLIDLRPERSVHILYGVVSLLIIPGVYAYTRGRDDRPEGLVYAALGLFTAGLILRAITTA